MEHHNTQDAQTSKMMKEVVGILNKYMPNAIVYPNCTTTHLRDIVVRFKTIDDEDRKVLNGHKPRFMHYDFDDGIGFFIEYIRFPNLFENEFVAPVTSMTRENIKDLLESTKEMNGGHVSLGLCNSGKKVLCILYNSIERDLRPKLANEFIFTYYYEYLEQQPGYAGKIVTPSLVGDIKLRIKWLREEVPKLPKEVIDSIMESLREGYKSRLETFYDPNLMG